MLTTPRPGLEKPQAPSDADRRSMSSYRQDMWLFLFIIPVAVGLFMGQGLVLAFGIIGIVVGAVSWLWNRVSLEEVSYERHLDRDRAFVGDEVPISITLTNRKPVPLGRVRVDDSIPPEIQVIGGDMGERHGEGLQTLSHSTSMSWYERVRWDYRLKCTRRGYYRIGPAQVQSGDLFGFYGDEKTLPDQDHLFVYPTVIPLPEAGRARV